MRITGGSYRGRVVSCPPGVIRPAMDRMRESLFAVLGDLTGCSFLDLYAGSGVVGIEAASRGAEPVVFVEKDPGKRAVLVKNTSFLTQARQIHIMPVERYLARQSARFDFIFLDPPFGQKGTEEVLRTIMARGTLAEQGLLLAHLPREQLPAEPPEGLRLADRRDYGRSVLLFYRCSAVTH
jgi:16S rRNA (guanine966-N2)-methyltransferase